MADSSAPQIPTTKSHNVQNANTRGRNSSRKPPLSCSDEQMKPPSSRQRSQSVTRKVPNPGSDKQVTFKTQGQSFDMRRKNTHFRTKPFCCVRQLACRHYIA
jgi:hypothetical protein